MDAREQSPLKLLVGWCALLLCLTIPAAALAVPRIQVFPANIAPDTTTGLFSFQVLAREVPAPGLGTFALRLEFDGADVELVTGGAVPRSGNEGKIVCATQLREAPVQTEVADAATLSLGSAFGDMVQASRHEGGILCLRNGAVDGQTIRYVCGVFGEVAPQSGDGALIELACAAGPDVAAGTSVTVTPAFLSESRETAAIFPFGQGEGVADIFDSGQILIVEAVNAPPSITSAPVIDATEHQAYSYDVDAGDPDDTADELVYGLVTWPGGMVIDADSGLIQWTPGNDDSGTHTVAVRVTDPGGKNDTQTYMLTVAAVNDPPQIVSAPVTDAVEHQAYSYDADAIDIDNDLDELIYSLVAPPTAMTIDADSGLIQWAPGNDDPGPYTVTVRVTDPGGKDHTQTFILTVAAVNDPPQIVSAPVTDALEHQAYSYDADASDPDNAPGELTFSLNASPAGMGIDASSGLIQWTPGNNDPGPHTVIVHVSDPDGLVGTQEYILDVEAVNDPPLLHQIGPQTAMENLELIIEITAEDPEEDFLEFALADEPTGATLFDRQDGSARFRWTPDFDQFGIREATVIVTDRGEPPRSDSERFTITVGDVNQPPVLQSIGAQSVNEGATLLLDLSANDPDGDPLEFAIADAPQGSSLIETGNGTAQFSWMPDFDTAGNYHPTITVTDGRDDPLGRASETVTISVGDVNRPPVLEIVGNRTLAEGESLMFTAVATDPDGNGLSLVLSGRVPADLVFTDRGNGTADISWSPTYDESGIYEMTLTVTDDGSPPEVDSEDFTVTVGNVNREPVLDYIGDRTVNEGVLLSVAVTGSDPDGDSVFFDLGMDAPASASLTPISEGSARFEWTPEFDDAGDHDVTIFLSDNVDPPEQVQQTFTVQVLDVNRGPILDAVPDQQLEVGDTLELLLAAEDPDEGDYLSFSVDGLPGGILTEYDNGTAMLVWTPQPGDAGDHYLMCTVSDGDMQDRDSFRISVNAAAESPPGDLNNDGVVTIADRSVFLAAYRARTGDPNFNAAADFDGDGFVSMYDYRTWWNLWVAAGRK